MTAREIGALVAAAALVVAGLFVLAGALPMPGVPLGTPSPATYGPPVWCTP